MPRRSPKPLPPEIEAIRRALEQQIKDSASAIEAILVIYQQQPVKSRGLPPYPANPSRA